MVIAHLGEAINKNALISSTEVKHLPGQECFVLKEDGIGSSIKSVYFMGFKKGASIGFKLDCKKLKQVSNYINDSVKGLNRACDAIIISKTGAKGVIFLCELKSTNPAGFESQIDAGEAFVDYLQSLIKRFYSNVELERFSRIRVLLAVESSKKAPSSEPSYSKLAVKKTDRGTRKILVPLKPIIQINLNQRMIIS